MIGDLPLMGSFFKARTRGRKEEPDDFCDGHHLDPAGNRVHSDDELPFAQSSIPPQEPGVVVKPELPGWCRPPAGSDGVRRTVEFVGFTV